MTSVALTLGGADEVPGQPEAHTGVRIDGQCLFVTITDPPGPPSKRGSVFYQREQKCPVLDHDWRTFLGSPMPDDAKVGILVKKKGKLKPVYADVQISSFSQATAGFVETGRNAQGLGPGSYDLAVTVRSSLRIHQIKVPFQICTGPGEFDVETIPLSTPWVYPSHSVSPF